MNALKVILKEKGMTQTMFAERLSISKQSVTRWVNRQKPMHENYIGYIENEWGIKKKYFVDERRYCKNLDISEKLELEDILLRQRFEQPVSTISEYKYYKNINNLSETELARREYLDQKYSMYYRRKKIDADIQKLIGRFRKDIRHADVTINYRMTSERDDSIENNISFYQNLMHLRESKKITMEEWNSVLKALYMLISKEEKITSDKVALDIYDILLANRLEKQQTNKENLEFYKSIWETPNLESEEEV